MSKPVSLNLHQFFACLLVAMPLAAYAAGSTRHVSFDDLRAGQELIGMHNEHADLVRRASWTNGKIFPVVQFGPAEHPLYQILDGHNELFALERLGETAPVEVRVEKDLTSLPLERQHEELAKEGFFWSPTNPDGHYESMKIGELRPSLWRAVAGDPEVKKYYSSRLSGRTNFKELIFGKEVFEELRREGKHPEKMDFEHLKSALLERPILGLSCQSVF